jgi:hypothetical protein
LASFFLNVAASAFTGFFAAGFFAARFFAAFFAGFFLDFLVAAFAMSRSVVSGAEV